MKKTHILMALGLFFLQFVTPALIAAELTGIFRRSEGMVQRAYLEIDGPGLVKKIEVYEPSLKDALDGQHMWVKGEISTYLEGSPEYVHARRWAKEASSRKHGLS